MSVNFNSARGRWCYDFQRLGKRYWGYVTGHSPGFGLRLEQGWPGAWLRA